MKKLNLTALEEFDYFAVRIIVALKRLGGTAKSSAIANLLGEERVDVYCKLAEMPRSRVMPVMTAEGMGWALVLGGVDWAEDQLRHANQELTRAWSLLKEETKE